LKRCLLSPWLLLSGTGGATKSRPHSGRDHTIRRTLQAFKYTHPLSPIQHTLRAPVAPQHNTSLQLLFPLQVNRPPSRTEIRSTRFPPTSKGYHPKDPRFWSTTAEFTLNLNIWNLKENSAVLECVVPRIVRSDEPGAGWELTSGFPLT